MPGHVHRIDLVDGIRRCVVQREIRRAIDVRRHRRDVAGAHRRTDVGPAAAGPMREAPMPASREAMAVTDARAVSLPVNPKPNGRKRSAVGLDHQDVVGQLGAVRVSVGRPAPKAVLFVR